MCCAPAYVCDGMLPPMYTKFQELVSIVNEMELKKIKPRKKYSSHIRVFCLGLSVSHFFFGFFDYRANSQVKFRGNHFGRKRKSRENQR